MKTDYALTAQDLFNTIVFHMLAQGRPSYDRGAGCCAYRSEGGYRCAVGIILSEDEYTKDMEGRQVGLVIAMGLFPPRLVPHAGLLSDMQGLHDREYEEYAEFFGEGNRRTKQMEKELIERFQRVAKAYSLRMPELVTSG